MKKTLNFVKNNAVGFVVGALLFGGIGAAVAANLIPSSDISYTTSKNTNVTNVKQAVDDLYTSYEDLKEYLPYNKKCDSSYIACAVAKQWTNNNGSTAKVYYHNGTITTTTAGIDGSGKVLDAEDKSYRYAGLVNNNYVCFGSATTPCPDANLYRIIGAFTDDGGTTYRVKLLKDKSYGNLAWDDSTNVSQYGSNTWGTSKLKSTLNGTFLTTLGDWGNLIYNATWAVGGHNFWDYLSGNVTPKTSYGNEILNPTGGTNKPTDGKMIDTFKIGLMYINDYTYAALPAHWNTVLYTETSGVSDYRTAAAATDWIFENFSGQYQWMISRRGEGVYNVCYVSSAGYVSGDSAYDANVVRPSFYLNSNVKLEGSHAGTAGDPYRLNLG